MRPEPVRERSRHLAVVLVAVDTRRGNHELLSREMLSGRGGF